MRPYLYLSMTPESLVASMLARLSSENILPWGRKTATRSGTVLRAGCGPLRRRLRSRPRGPACVHADGRPKNSLYLSIYRVLERVPLTAIKSLWLASERGKVSELTPSATLPTSLSSIFSTRKMFQFTRSSPVAWLAAFAEYITRPNKPLYVPRICFLDIDLAEMATDPEHGKPRELYYPDHYWHLRGCLLELRDSQTKSTKTVDRSHAEHFPYHCIKHGFYVGDLNQLLFLPFPAYNDLHGKHHDWWHSVRH